MTEKGAEQAMPTFSKRLCINECRRWDAGLCECLNAIPFTLPAAGTVCVDKEFCEKGGGRRLGGLSWEEGAFSHNPFTGQNT